MLDSIKVEQSQEAKTALDYGTATARAFYFVSGYCMESLLYEETRFNEAMKKCIAHMMNTAKDQTATPDDICIYKCYEGDAMGTALIKFSTDWNGLYMVDLTRPTLQREKVYIDRKTALKKAADIYREVLLEADQESRKAA